MKHIESILPEYAADELDRIVREEGDATATAALTALLHSVTGCDIPQTSDLPESEVEELVPLCVSILRRHWQTPLTCLGDGTTPMSLSDLMRQAIGDRVQGNEAWSIPAVHANLPTALAALTKRHIDDGLTLTLTDGTVASLPDGISLAQVLGSVANEVTELTDSNHGWTMSKAFANGFPNAKKVTLGCKTLHASPSSMFPNAEEFDFPALDHIDTGESGHPQINLLYGSSIKRINMPALKRFRCVNASYMGVFYNLTSPCEIYMENCESINGTGGTTYPVGFHTVTGLTKLVLGTCTGECIPFRVTSVPDNLVHLELGAGTRCNVQLQWWTATTALSERLDEFLSNFQLYIADRVADRTGQTALTLTLSAAVYEALQAQEGQTILATLTNKNWTVAQA